VDGAQKMENDNLLSDLENDICKDWNDIRNEFLKKELNEEKNKLEKRDTLQRPHIPDYKLFIDMMLCFIHNPDDPSIRYDLRRLFLDLLYRSDSPMPKSFIKVWRMFFSPMDYECAPNIQCISCHSIFDVIYERQRMRFNLYDDIYGVNGFNEFNEISVKTTRAYCPNCGLPLINFTDSKLIGIFEQHKERNNMEKENYGIKREFRTNF
jgi:hypothetical protein